MSTFAVILAVIASVLAFVGAISLTQATNGVGLVALGCLVAIGARLAQASSHQRKLEALLQPRTPLKPVPAGPQPEEQAITAQNVDDIARRYGASGQ